MLRIVDGLASALAALATLMLTLVPAWFTHRAIATDAAPPWAYGPAGALAVVGLVLALAFGRKALRGIAPSRDRAR
jgi:membrane protein implicated in regulation of membrane protease activity